MYPCHTRRLWGELLIPCNFPGVTPTDSMPQNFKITLVDTVGVSNNPHRGCIPRCIVHLKYVCTTLYRVNGPFLFNIYVHDQIWKGGIYMYACRAFNVLPTDVGVSTEYKNTYELTVQWLHFMCQLQLRYPTCIRCELLSQLQCTNVNPFQGRYTITICVFCKFFFVDTIYKIKPDPYNKPVKER